MGIVGIFMSKDKVYKRSHAGVLRSRNKRGTGYHYLPPVLFALCEILAQILHTFTL